VLASHFAIVQTLVGPLAPALLGPRAGVILDSFTFLFSAFMVMSMRISAQPPRRTGRLSLSLIGKDAVESLQFLGTQKNCAGDHDVWPAILRRDDHPGRHQLR
jgi:hypothetical protein